MARAGLAQPRLRVDRFQAHHLRQPPHSMAPHLAPLAVQPVHPLAASIEGALCIYLVDERHQPQVLRILAARLVIQPRPVHAQQFTLTPQTDFAVAEVHQLAPPLSRADQHFFEPVEFHFQPADLLVQRLLLSVLISALALPAVHDCARF